MMELNALVAIAILYGMTVGVSSNFTSVEPGQSTTNVTEFTSHANTTLVTTETPGPTTTRVPESTSHTNTPLVTSEAPPPCERWLAKFNGVEKYCIIIQADLNVTINDNNQTNDFHVNQNSTSYGTCGTTSQVLTIRDKGLQLTWNFDEGTDNRTFGLTNITITDHNSNISATINMSGLWLSNLYKTKMFQCNAMKMVNGTSGTSTFTITFRNLKLEAFQNTSSPCDFVSEYVQCQDDVTVSNLVPIIVGACLGGLIVIVLVAYLIGRRRSRRGYESV